MARIVGGITTSHIPAIGKAIQRGKSNDPDWKPFFDGYVPVRAWLDAVKPDVAVVVYNDHGLNFFLDQIPTFAMVQRRSTRIAIPAGASTKDRQPWAPRKCRGT